MIRSRLVAVAMSLAFASAALAQTTASLTGTVTTGGQPLAGVTVTISSPALQGMRVAITGESGAYDFASLPPGHYRVVFTRPDFVAIPRNAVLRLSQTARVEGEMYPRATDLQITVTAPVEPVLERPQVSTSLTLQQIERLPVLRNQLATAQFAPGVNGNTLSNGQLQISGGPGYDNLVLVNGVVVTENTRGQMRPMYVEDAIQETTVLTGAISARVRALQRRRGQHDHEVGRQRALRLAARLARAARAGRRRRRRCEARESRLNHVWESDARRLRDARPALVLHRRTLGEERHGAADGAVPRSPIPPRPPPAISYAEGNDQKRWEGKLTAQLGARQTRRRVVLRHPTRRGRTSASTPTSTTWPASPRATIRSRSWRCTTTAMLAADAAGSRGTTRRANSPTAAAPSPPTSSTARSCSTAPTTTPASTRRRSAASATWSTATTTTSCSTTHAFLDAGRRGSHDLVGRRRPLHASAATRTTTSRGATSRSSSRACSARTACSIRSITPTNADRRRLVHPLESDPRSARREDDLRTDSAFVNDVWSLGTRWQLSARRALGPQSRRRCRRRRELERPPALAAPLRAVRHPRRRPPSPQRLVRASTPRASPTASPRRIRPPATPPRSTSPTEGRRSTTARSTTPLADAIRLVFDYFNSTQGGTGNRAAGNLRANGTRTRARLRDVLRRHAALAVRARADARLRRASSGATAYARADVVHRDWHDFYAASVTTATQRANTPLGIPVDLALVRNSNNVQRRYRGVQLQARWTPRARSTSASSTRGRRCAATTRGRARRPARWRTSIRRSSIRSSSPTSARTRSATCRATSATACAPGPATTAGRRGSARRRCCRATTPGCRTRSPAPINLTRYAGAPENPGYNADPERHLLLQRPRRAAHRRRPLDRPGAALRAPPRPHRVLRAGRRSQRVQLRRDRRSDAPRHDGQHRRDVDGVRAVRPREADPVECPRGAAAACTAMGANYQLAANFGQPLNDLAYQRPRTFRISVGARF